MPFHATHFVYAFFVFNSTYSFDWKKSIEQDKPISYTKDPPEDTPGETVQRNKLLRLLAAYSTREEFREKVQEKLRSLEEQCKPGKWQAEQYLWNANHLDNIEPDTRIKKENLPKYIAAWRNFFPEHQEPEASYKKDLIELHNLIYDIRCNIFHGRKKLVDMLDCDQRDRLMIYTSILYATNELFLKKVNEELNKTENHEGSLSG